MERRIDLSNLDLDEATSATAARRSGWLARGLRVHPLTWMDNDAPWPRPLLTERSAVNRPMSLGLRLEGEAGAEAEFMVYAGGWVDVGLVAPGGDQVVQEYVEFGGWRGPRRAAGSGGRSPGRLALRLQAGRRAICTCRHGFA
jgi:hypothetical protein